ncbi:MAG: deoxyribonuclease IV [Candidatus Micrarchaeia archaeon]
MIKLGFHVSISGGIWNAPEYARKNGYGAFQIFPGNSRSWKSPAIPNEDAKRFKGIVKESSLDPFAHIPYLCNPASPDTIVLSKSVEMIKESMTRCSILGIKYLVLHMGSHKGIGAAKGVENVVKSLTGALDSVKGVDLLLENSAGYANSIGSNFEEIGRIIDEVGSRRLGMCLDTCHAFAAGYDIRDPKAIGVMEEEIKSNIGEKRLRLTHLNDARYGLGSGLDRHWHIGKGEIGKKGFVNLFRNSFFGDGPFIMETPVNSQGNDSTNMAAALEIIAEAKGQPESSAF